MRNTDYFFLLSQSILLPIISGLVRWRRAESRYQPFFYLLLIGWVTECIGYFLIKNHRPNGWVMNGYILIEWVIIAWQFHLWGLFAQRRRLFLSLVALVSLIWVGEYFIFGSIREYSPYFRCLYYFLIVLMSINNINFMITHYSRSLFRNPKFLFCIGFLIYFVFMILDYWAYQVSRYNKSTLSSTFVFLMAYVNVGTNIIYAVAYLLIPAQVRFKFDLDSSGRPVGNGEL